MRSILLFQFSLRKKFLIIKAVRNWNRLRLITVSVQAEAGQWIVRDVIERIPELGARLYYGYLKLLTIKFWWAELEMAINSFFPSQTLVLLWCNSNTAAKLHSRDRSPSGWSFWSFSVSVLGIGQIWPLLKFHMPTFSFSKPVLYSPLSTRGQAVCFNSQEATYSS